MNFEKCTLPALTIIGHEGSTQDGPGFIQKLWAESTAHFDEIASLVMRDADGTPVGFWGAMTDRSRNFQPWENNFSEGLYLAGAECVDGAEPPAGWTKWVIPSYEYLKADNDQPDSFPRAISHLAEVGLSLAGAVHDFTDPHTGRNYLMIPIRKI